MTTAELDQLVAQIGDEILTQLQSRPGSVCPVCQQPYSGRASTPIPRPSPAAVPNSIAALIDHTLLKPDATESDIIRVCDEAIQHGFASVCINPDWVPTVAERLAGSPVKVCTVVGFPLGATTTEAKLHETAAALRCGAQEIDMVQNVGALRSGNTLRVEHDIAAIARLAHSAGALVKVIFETCLLDDAQKKLACRLAVEAGADFVKTSTGFSTGGATVEDIALMRAHVPASMGVKASGGIRTLEDLRKMVAAGATRIGASASVAIVQGASNAPQTGY